MCMTDSWGQGNGSWLRSTGGSCRAPGLYSQYPHGSSQFSVTPDPKHLPSPSFILSCVAGALLQSLSSLTSSSTDYKSLSPNLPSPNSSHFPCLQLQQAFTGNTPAKWARDTSKPNEDAFFLSSNSNPLGSSLCLQQNTCSSLPYPSAPISCGSQSPTSANTPANS